MQLKVKIIYHYAPIRIAKNKTLRIHTLLVAM